MNAFATRDSLNEIIALNAIFGELRLNQRGKIIIRSKADEGILGTEYSGEGTYSNKRVNVKEFTIDFIKPEIAKELTQELKTKGPKFGVAFIAQPLSREDWALGESPLVATVVLKRSLK